MRIDRIALLEAAEYRRFQEKHVERIKKAVPGVEVIHAFGAADLLAKTADVDVLAGLLHATPEEVAFCKGAPSLKLIHVITSGVDFIMKSEIRNLDVRITATKGPHAYAMAEHTLAFIFAFLRGFPTLFRAQMNRQWDRSLVDGKVGETVGKTVGVIGLGHVGTRVAERCKREGMRVVAAKRTPVDSELVDRCYAMSEMDGLLQESDFVVVALPITPETRHLLGERELRLMKPTAYLINIARGEIIDEEALVKALQEKAIAGAGLDAATREPLPPESPLWDMPNVIITPHMSASSPLTNERSVEIMIENLLRFSRDEELLFEVDKTTGY